MLTVLTPTGGRQKAFNLLAIYLNRQTLEQFRWVIVDDCEPCTIIPVLREGIHVVTVYPEHQWQPGMNTQALSILSGLEHCSERIAVCEDDDYYAPGYLEAMNDRLDSFDLVGEAPSLYYHTQSRTLSDMGNTQHASLACTAMKGQAIAELREICQTKPTRIDQRLWKGSSLAKHLGPRLHTLGIKGLPGRPGIGIGHRMTGKPCNLSDLIGDDARIYQ